MKKEIILDQNSLSIQEVLGNNDGNLNPSEEVEFSFSIQNISSQQANDLYLELSTLSDYITITNSNMLYDSYTTSGTWIYDVTFTDNNGCTSTSPPFTVVVSDGPLPFSISTTGPIPICPNEESILTHDGIESAHKLTNKNCLIHVEIHISYD